MVARNESAFSAYTRRHAGRRQRDPGEGRPHDRGGLEEDGVEPDGVGQVLARHETREERLPGGGVGRARRRAEARDEQDDPGVRQARRRHQGERRGGQHHHDLGDEHEPPAIDGVRHHAAPEPEHENRADPREADQAERQRLPARWGEERDVPEDRRPLHHRARHRHELAQPEQAEVPVAQRDERRRGGRAARLRRRLARLRRTRDAARPRPPRPLARSPSARDLASAPRPSGSAARSPPSGSRAVARACGRHGSPAGCWPPDGGARGAGRRGGGRAPGLPSCTPAPREAGRRSSRGRRSGTRRARSRSR